MIRSRSRYVLIADAALFYGSIYTHTIPWVMHGKAIAKSNRSHALVGNLLDHLVQYGQDAQTLGIPIGPDTSFVIAEIIGAGIDSAFSGRLVSPIRGLRRVDDQEYGFGSLAEAEEALGALQEAHSEYELSLNASKTRIEQMPLPVEDPWVAQFRRFEFRPGAGREAGELIDYFDMAFAAARSNRGIHVLSFAVGGLGQRSIATANLGLYHDLLLQCAAAEASTLSRVLSELKRIQAAGHAVDVTAIADTLNGIVIAEAPRTHGNEVAWALWGLIEFGLPIDAQAARKVIGMEDNVVALVALDAQRRGLMPPGFVAPWGPLMTVPELQSENWLLAYEANVKGWLPSASVPDHVALHAEFSRMKTAGVSFYDPTRGVRTGVAPVGAPDEVSSVF